MLFFGTMFLYQLQFYSSMSIKRTDPDFIRIRKGVIKKLHSLDKWTSNHLLIKNLESGFPSHEIGKVREVVKLLIKDRLLISKPTKHGMAVSLNESMKKEIMFIRGNF